MAIIGAHREGAAMEVTNGQEILEEEACKVPQV